MNITTTFSCGDKGWVFDYATGGAWQATVGKVQVEVTDSPGTGEEVFDNYKAQRSYEEKYMCVETGIGSGSVYTLGEHIFTTEAECLAANAKRIEERAAARLRDAEMRKRSLLDQKARIDRELAAAGIAS